MSGALVPTDLSAALLNPDLLSPDDITDLFDHLELFEVTAGDLPAVSLPAPLEVTHTQSATNDERSRETFEILNDIPPQMIIPPEMLEILNKPMAELSEADQVIFLETRKTAMKKYLDQMQAYFSSTGTSRENLEPLQEQVYTMILEEYDQTLMAGVTLGLDSEPALDLGLSLGLGTTEFPHSSAQPSTQRFGLFFDAPLPLPSSLPNPSFSSMTGPAPAAISDPLSLNLVLGRRRVPKRQRSLESTAMSDSFSIPAIPAPAPAMNPLPLFTALTGVPLPLPNPTHLLHSNPMTDLTGLDEAPPFEFDFS